MKRILMIVASKDFPAPEEYLLKHGALEVRHETSTPQGLPLGCVGVVSVTKMSSHTMSQRARRLANEAGLPFGNANSSTGVIRLAEEWGLVRKIEKLTLHQPSSIVGGRGNDTPGMEIVVMDPRREVPTYSPPPAEEPVQPIATSQPEPAQEIKVTKKKARSGIEGAALLVAGLPRGPYRRKSDIYNEACKFREFGEAKDKKKGPWTYPNWGRKGGVHDTATEAGIITKDNSGQYFVEHDPSIKLTPYEVTITAPVRSSTILDTNGHSPFFKAGVLVLKNRYADIEKIIEDRLLSEEAVEKVGREAFEKFLETLKNPS